MKEIKASEGWLRREQMDLDILHHRSDAVTSKDTCLDALKVIISFVFFSLATGVTHEKKNKGKKGLAQRYQGHIYQAPESPQIWELCSSWAQNFSNSQSVLTPKVRQFSAQRKAVLQGSGKRSEDFLYINQLLENNIVNELSEHESGTYGLNFPQNTPWGPSFRGSGGGVKILRKIQCIFLQTSSSLKCFQDVDWPGRESCWPGWC